LGKYVGLSLIERQRLGIKTMRPYNIPLTDLKMISKNRRRIQARINRRKKRLQEPLSKRKPWEKENMSERTWYRRNKQKPPR
jgi:hypothetical protein